MRERVSQYLNSHTNESDVDTMYSALLDKHGVRLCVLGHRSILPPDVLKAVHKAESLTKHNNKYATSCYMVFRFLMSQLQCHP